MKILRAQRVDAAGSLRTRRRVRREARISRRFSCTRFRTRPVYFILRRYRFAILRIERQRPSAKTLLTEGGRRREERDTRESMYRGSRNSLIESSFA